MSSFTPMVRRSFQALLAGFALLTTPFLNAEIVHHYNSVNWLVSREDTVDPTKSQFFGYDRNGNLTSTYVNGSTRTYIYDPRDQLVEVQQDGIWIARYGYDFEGRRNLKVDPTGSIHQYIYDGRHILAEYDGAGAQVAKFDWAGNQLISMTFRDTGLFFPEFDGPRRARISAPANRSAR